MLKASEELLSKGFSKKEPVALPKKKEKETPQPPKKVVTIMKTTAEKNERKSESNFNVSTVGCRLQEARNWPIGTLRRSECLFQISGFSYS